MEKGAEIFHPEKGTTYIVVGMSLVTFSRTTLGPSDGNHGIDCCEDGIYDNFGSSFF